MKTNLIAYAAFGIICFVAGTWFGDKTVPIKSVANSYFRAGEQAALIALNKRRRLEEHFRTKYPTGSYTNKQDFETATDFLSTIDDPRIFSEFRFLNGYGVYLDESSWVCTNGKNCREWTLLKN